MDFIPAATAGGGSGASIGTATPQMDGVATAGSSTTAAADDHVHPTDTSRAALASPTFTGTPAAPTAAQGTSTTQVATTAMVQSEVTLLAPKLSPTLTGTPLAPTAVAATSTTQIATTAMVQAAIAAQAGAVGGFAKYVRRTSSSSTITSSSALASDDTLLIAAVTSSDIWFVEVFATFTAADSSGAATTADMKWGWSLPTGWTQKHGAVGNLGNQVPGWGWTSSANTPLAILTTGGQGAGMFVGEVGLYAAVLAVGDASHTGNINFQWAQNTSNAATLQIMSNSFLRATRLA